MGNLQKTLAKGLKLRLMLMGEAMTMKTTFISQAAELGFNVIYFDGDGNPQAFSRLSDKAKDHVSYFEGMDSLGESTFALLLTHVKNMEPFLFNERKKDFVKYSLKSMVDKSAPYALFDPTKLTLNDIVVFDSWTAYIHSLVKRYVKESGKDIDANVEFDGDWKDYRWTGLMADDFATKIKEFPCHVCVIAHAETWERKDKKGNVLATKVKAISSSRQQSEKLPKFFTDVFHFVKKGPNFHISCKPNAEILAGSRSVPPFDKKFTITSFKDNKEDEFSFTHLAKVLGLVASGEPTQAVKFFEPGELMGSKPVSVTSPISTPQVTEKPIETSGVIDVSQPPTVKKVFSLSNLKKA